MNILVICHEGLYRDLTSSFVHNQAREYAALGHKVRALIPIGLGKKDRRGSRFGKILTPWQADGVELFELRYLTLSSYGEGGFNVRSAIAAVRMRFSEIFRDFVPDVIQAHTLGFDSELGAWLKKKWNCPLVVTSHGSDAVRPMEQGRQTQIRNTCDKADRIIAVSDPLGALIRSCGTVTPVGTIHNGFVLRQASGEAPRDPFEIIQVGHLVPSKKTDVTIRAFARLKQRYPKLHLTIVGTGAQRQALEQLAEELGVGNAVAFLGQLPNQEVFRRMEESTFFVMASAPEGFGIVYLEAMSAGCVVIGARGQGIADVIREGENGFLVPVDDAEAIAEVLGTCLENRAWAEKIALAGRNTALRMTWPVNAQDYLDLFQKLREEI